MSPEAKSIIHIEDRPEDIQLVKRVVDKELKEVHLVSLDDSEMVMNEIEDGSFLLRRPDLIIIDIKMPKISGLELLNALNAHPEYNRVPKIIFSSSTHPTDLENAYNLKVNSYVEKPKDYAGLKETLLGLVKYWIHLNLT